MSETHPVANWKEVKIAEYSELEHEIGAIACEMATDKDLSKLTLERNKLSKAIIMMQSLYTLQIEAKQQTQAGIKAELIDNWDVTGKTFECDAGTATLRTTKSVRIRSKAKLIDFLSLNKKLTEYIKAFDTSKLRKIKEAELIGSDVIDWDERKSVAISVKESEQ